MTDRGTPTLEDDANRNSGGSRALRANMAFDMMVFNGVPEGQRRQVRYVPFPPDSEVLARIVFNRDTGQVEIRGPEEIPDPVEK